MEPSEKSQTEAPQPPLALKDKLALKVKALQHAAPGAAADLKARVKAGASAAGFDRINRDSLKAGRDGLAAKVEALLKPRPVDPTADVKPTPVMPETKSGPGKTQTDDVGDRADISALKAKLDAALRPKDETPTTARADAAAQGIAARIAAALPKADWKTQPWTAPFTRSKRAASGDMSSPAERGTRLAGSSDTVSAVQASIDVMPDVATVRTRRTERLNTERIVARTRPKRSLLTIGMLATALVTGAVLHIVTTFAIPALSSSWFRWSAFDRIKPQLDANTMKVWPLDPTGAMPLPFLSPDMRYAFCRYDITSGPVAVSAVLPEAGWSLALYTPSGDNFYAVPGQDGRAVEAVFNIVPASDRLLIPVPGQRRADVDAALVTSGSREGLIVIRGPNKGAASTPAVDAALRRARCAAVERR
jgi:uncharacterized membrane protein